jgi:hypothetical protein
LTNWFHQEGAITLGDVIVFSDGGTAQNDLALWAHELTHVLQYENMGIETFAFEYLYDWQDLESQAESNSNAVMASLESVRIGNGTTWGYDASSGSPDASPTWQRLHNVALETLDPSSCIWIDQQKNRTGNQCPIAIRVTEIIVERISDGYIYRKPCNAPTCVFYPNDNEPMISPVGSRIIGVGAAYQQ